MKKMTGLIKLGGLLPMTMIDFPGKLAAVLFLQGCNLRCRFCYNCPLLAKSDEHEPMPPTFEEAVNFLQNRRGFLDGVVFSGGEPCQQKGLLQAIDIVKNLGYEIGIHTNGTYASVIKKAVNQNLLDFIAVDYKAPLDKYEKVCGFGIDEEAYSDLADFIVASGVKYEYRTTIHPELLSESDLIEMSHWLKQHKIGTYAVQEFMHGNALDKSLAPVTGKLWLPERAAAAFKEAVPGFIIRAADNAGLARAVA